MHHGLNLRRQKFLVAYLRSGNATRAAKEAGYKGNAAYLAVQGSRLIRNDKVQAALSIACADLNPQKWKQLIAARLEAIPQTEWRWDHWLRAAELSGRSIGMHKPGSQNMQIGKMNLLQLQNQMMQRAVTAPNTPAADAGESNPTDDNVSS